MKRPIWLWTWACLVLQASGGLAQTITDERVWLGVTVTTRVAKPSPWRLTVDSMLRSRDRLDALDAWHVRPAVGRDLTSRISVWAGYGFFRGYPSAGGVRDEHRVFQQLLLTGSRGRVSWTSRSRLEQRQLDGNHRLSWRVRQQWRLVRQFGDSRVSMVVWDEVALHLNTTTRTRRGFDQNRAFVGLGVVVSPGVRVETGYHNHYQRGIGIRTLNHILLTTVGVTF